MSRRISAGHAPRGLRIVISVTAALTVAGCDSKPGAEARPDSIATRATAAVPAAPAVPDSIARPAQPRIATPKVVRGLYVNRWAALGQRMGDLIDIAKKTEVNALVIDVKDDRGFVLYKSRVPLANQIGADTTRPMSAQRLRGILDTMVAHNIYPIGRIVVAKDPLLARAKLDWAIKRKDNLEPWLDKNGNPWLDPHQKGVWQYAADL